MTVVDQRAAKASNVPPTTARDLMVLDTIDTAVLEAGEPVYGRVTIGLAVLLTFFCFVTFQHQDISHTVGCTMALFRGHMRDFYDHNLETLPILNYLPTTYWLYALVGLPIKLLGYVPEPGWATLPYVWYFKAFNTLAYVGTSVLLRRIAQQMRLSSSVATFTALLWLTTPVAFFSQFIFGQYDILTLFFFMGALHFYLQGRLATFTACVAICLTFKYYPLFCYVPLLLLAEKRIGRVLLHAVAVFVPIAIEVYIYRHSPAFHEGIFGFVAANFVFRFFFDVGGIAVSAVFMAWFGVCAYAWLVNCDDGADWQRRALFVVLAGVAPVFVLSKYHPQWAIFITPFLCLVAGPGIHRRRLMSLDVVMAFALYGYGCGYFPNSVDQHLAHLGFFGRFNPNFDVADKVVGMLPSVLIDKKMLFPALFNAIFLAYVCMSWPTNLKNGRSSQSGECVERSDIRGLWVRFFAGVGVWILLSARSYFLTLQHV